VLIVSVAAFVISFGELEKQLDAQGSRDLETSLRGTLDSYEGPSIKRIEALTEEIERRRQRGEAKFDVLLRRRDGTVLAGRLRLSVEPLIGCRPFIEGGTRFVACGIVLENLAGMPERDGQVEEAYLLAAAEHRREPSVAFWGSTGILVIAGISVPAVALLAYASSRRIERRLRSISLGARAVMDGDLTRRLPTQGSADELDRLVLLVNEMLERIDGLVREVRHVTDDIAHDLRRPLARMRKELDDALGRAREPEADRVTFHRARDDVDEILRSFDDVLYIAGIQSDEAHVAVDVVDLSRLLQTLGEIYQAAAEDEHGKTLALDVPDGLQVLGDEGRLGRLVVNLIENALKHGGSNVGISARRLDDRRVELRIVDDGPGVPAADRSNVLKRFYRLDRSRSTPGSGLGLAIVAAVARLHRAELSLEDNSPGLAVTIRFPGFGSAPDVRLS
jgi:signal transduction histidine kinase